VRFIALAVLVGCAPMATRTPLRDLSVAQQERQAVWIDVSCHSTDESWPSWASGGIVSDRHVLTAKHVIDWCHGAVPEIWATVSGDRQRYRMAWFRDLSGDQVLLERADAGRWSWAQRPRPAQVVIGDEICAETAAPLRRRKCGIVAERYVRETDHHGTWTRYEYDTTPGNSGSLIYDRWGHLVGVHSAHERNTTRAYMVPVDWRRLP
jgi:trypsin-like peptidase